MQRLKTAFLLVILTVSCNKPFNDVPTETVTFSATFAESIHTRVSVDSGAKNYCWTPGDRISITCGTDAVESEFISDAPSDTASFKVNKTWSAEDFDNYRASSVIGCSKDAISVILPSIQRYVSGSFDREACVMVAVTGSKDDYNLKFRSVCGFIKVPVFSVGDAAIKKISICGNGGEIVAGAASIEAAPEKGPVIVMTSAGIPDSLSVAGDGFSYDSGCWETKTSEKRGLRRLPQTPVWRIFIRPQRSRSCRI